ncbi:MAG: hypothetical protein LBM08_02705 [Dysgonamonadaceae bacterium]|nr:hypothetical protein [Dysgonamonadaceae bacterium]
MNQNISAWGFSCAFLAGNARLAINNMEVEKVTWISSVPDAAATKFV